MPSRFDEPPADEIDLGRRYDVYVAEQNHRVVVYRGAMVRGVRAFGPGSRTGTSDFLELEQSNGDTVFVRRFGVVKLCPPGTRLTEEQVTPPEGERPAT